MNMQIADLNTAVELDRAALIQVLGAGAHAYDWRHTVSRKYSSKYFSKTTNVIKGNKRVRVRKYFRRDKQTIKHTYKRQVLTGMVYL